MARLAKSEILKAQENQTWINAVLFFQHVVEVAFSKKKQVFDLSSKIFDDDGYFRRDGNRNDAYVLQHPKTVTLWISVEIIAFS